MDIRYFQIQDAPKLATLFYRSIHEMSSKHYCKEQIDVWAPKERDLAAWVKSFENKHVFIAEEGGEIAGFGELESNGHIDRFYVSPDFAGSGTGKFIYQHLEEEAIRLGQHRLFVEASLTARPFFERMGFKVIKEQTVYRSGIGLNNFQMEKRI